MALDNYVVDEEEVNKIVDTMKKKYRAEGLAVDEVNTSLKELRGIITEDTYSKIDIETEADLEGFGSDTTRFFGNIYLKIKDVMKPIQTAFKNLSITKELGYYLYSANMPYSANQYLAISTTAGLIIGLLVLVITLLVTLALGNITLIFILPLAFGILAWLVSTIIILLMPKQKAIAVGNACSIELPFALRHMATELKSGLGLYKTLQTIAATDYGALSAEFARTITEIEEGTDTGVALKHLALRTQSRPLKTAINHMLRAMRVGGNLSEAMSTIAKDVSEEMKIKINTFSQNMNFFAVVFIFVGIVLPVAVMILGAIRNSPIAAVGQDLFKSVPLTIDVMILFFFVLMPILFTFLNFVIYRMQPKM